MSSSPPSSGPSGPVGGGWRHGFAVVTALATLGLVGMGGLVTSHGVGMAVPDWPTSYGYNMFALPISTWLTGGIFHEHTHRLWASLVGVLVVALTRWLGGRAASLPLLIIGAVEIVAGISLLQLGADWKGAGHFLAGIGGVVLLGGVVWVKNTPASGRLPWLGWAAFWLVQLQGLLGGLRVVLDAQMVGDVRLGTAFGVFHGCLGQAFLVLTAVIALLTGRWWRNLAALEIPASTRNWFLGTTLLIFLQLLIAATMRHQHAGLAIPDFPLAHGKLWPDLSEAAVASYNLKRVEVTVANPITAFQIGLQMVHRLVALLILGGVAVCVVKSRPGTTLRRFAGVWLGLILVQVALGAWTIWSNKAADVATAHVVVGALSLVTGALACLICFRRLARNQAVATSAAATSVIAGPLSA
jgi:cytochrome c oxidase assembly protein subunit 15